MATNRPYLKKSGAELADIFERSRANANDLRELLKELQHRATPSASILRRKVEVTIREITEATNGPSSGGNKEGPSHHSLECRQCHTNLRIPSRQGAVVYTCPSCKAEFEVSLLNEVLQVTWVEKVKAGSASNEPLSESTARSILGVSASADFSEIKNAWRKASQQYHPDKHQGLPERLRAAAEIEMKRINEAYRFLERLTCDDF